MPPNPCCLLSQSGIGMRSLAWAVAASLLVLSVLTLAAAISPACAQVRPAADTLDVGTSDTLALSQWAVAPGTDTLWAQYEPHGVFVVIPRSSYDLPLGLGILVWVDSVQRPMSVVLRYRYFEGVPPPTLALRAPPGAKPTTDSAGNPIVPVFINPIEEAPQDNFFDPGSLQRSGSFTRSITLGTGRDLAVNSDFRLQLSGFIADDIAVNAALTDQNIPIQPSGTTQQINDFDAIYIQLKKGPYSITFGDLEVNPKHTRFASFYRNVLGVSAKAELGRTGTPIGTHALTLTGSAAKGQFHTNTITGVEGKQGPYRLTGKNNERFIIVLAGSEKVYINGLLMQRGEDRDYEIEYNTGELLFMPRCVITAASRIVVDFEYADRVYTRTLIYAENLGTLLNDKLKLGLSFARQSDNPNAPVDLTIGDAERAAARAAGDNASLSFTPGADSVGWSATEVRYLRRDTTVLGVVYPNVLVYSTDSLLAHYRTTFSYTGPNGGNYRKTPRTINGNIFEWVAPQNGIPQGDFEPIRVVPLPAELQVYDLMASYQLTQHLQLYSEAAISNWDINRLSPLNDDDNRDVATTAGLKVTGLPVASWLKLNADARFQYVGSGYTGIDRVYKVEYGREWNYNDLGSRLIERLGEGTVEGLFWQKFRLKINAGARSFGDSLLSVKQNYEIESTDSNIVLGRHLFSFIETTDRYTGQRSRWMRHNGVYYRIFFGWLKPGVITWLEQRANYVADTLTIGSFGFSDLTAYLRTDKLEKWEVDLSLNTRVENEFASGAYRSKFTALMPSLKANWRPAQHWLFNLTATYRQVRVQDTVFITGSFKDQDNITGQFNFGYTPGKKLFNVSGLYQVLTEQVTRRDMSYVQVTPGLGQYEWLDANQNGIQELDEFQLSTNPLTANFVRLMVPTTDLVPAVGVSFGTTLRLDFGNALPKAEGPEGFGRRLLRNISLLTSLRLDQKSSANQPRPSNYLIRFDRPALADSSLLSSNYTFRQDLFLFRNAPGGDAQLSYLDSRVLQFLTSGNELRTNQSIQLRMRLNFSQNRSLEALLLFGQKANVAQVLQNRAFDIRQVAFTPNLTFQFGTRYRLTGGYEFKWKDNRNTQGITDAILQTHKLIIDSKLNLSLKNNISLRSEAFYNLLNGRPVSTTASFELLESMAPGANLTINLMFTQFLSEFLELNVVYDGRWANTRPPLHSLRMQVRAVF